MRTTEEHDLLGGVDLLATDTPATTEKSKASKKKTTAKKKAAPAPAEKPVKAKRTPKLVRGEDKNKVVRHEKPKLDSQSLAVIAVIADAGGYGVPYSKLAKKVFGKNATDADLKGLAQSLRAKKLIQIGDDEEKHVIIHPDAASGALKSSNLTKLFKNIPSDPGKGLTAGRLGGLVFGGGATKEEDIWVNVRYGRAMGRVLQRLLLIGAVGCIQYRDEHNPVLYYKLGQ